MACFTGPIIGKIVVSMLRRSIENRNMNNQDTILWSTRLKWLENMFLGGTALLVLEHIWHGEIIFSFPFLTAVKNGETMVMLKEIATVGFTMTGTILLVWIGMILIAEHHVRKAKLQTEP